MYIRKEFFYEAYEELIKQLLYSPDYVCEPRGMKINESLNACFVVDSPNVNMYKNVIRSSPKKYIAAEIFWYLMGDRDIDFIGKYASLWKHIAMDNCVCSNYGYLLFKNKLDNGMTQFAWAYESLKNDKDSRQAIMHFNLPMHQFAANKDFVCTMFAQFFIRNNKLHMSIHMRSNDIVFGLSSDYTFFNLVHQQMHKHLLSVYPDLEIGSYFHYAGSMHIYERHFEMMEKSLQHPWEGVSTPEIGNDLVGKNGFTNAFFHDNIKKFMNGQVEFNEDDKLFSWCIDSLTKEKNNAS